MFNNSTGNSTVINNDFNFFALPFVLSASLNGFFVLVMLAVCCCKKRKNKMFSDETINELKLNRLSENDQDPFSFAEFRDSDSENRMTHA